MKLKACNRIGLVLAGVWILWMVVYGGFSHWVYVTELILTVHEHWINPPFAILVVGSVAAYLLPFLVGWILKGFVE
jgi:hypothetical protein